MQQMSFLGLLPYHCPMQQVIIVIFGVVLVLYLFREVIFIQERVSFTDYSSTVVYSLLPGKIGGTVLPGKLTFRSTYFSFANLGLRGWQFVRLFVNVGD